MKVLCYASGKGGVSKTSDVIYHAQALAKQGHKVAVIDFDHNNNCTDYFLRDISVEEIDNKNLYHVLTGKKNINECIYSTKDTIDVIPATPRLARIEIELVQDPGALLRFPAMLRKLNYHYVLIDTPPSLSFALTAALYASDIVICPVSWSRWTIQGFSLLNEKCMLVSQSSGTNIKIYALPSMVTDIEHEKLRAVDIWTVANSYISKNIAIKNAGTSGTALKPDSISWKQFQALAKEFQ